MKKTFLTVFLSFLLCNTSTLLAQIEPEEVALDKDEFRESYYESLIQKGIENYDKAIESLEKCLKIQPENAVIHHELGKNYFYKKDYINAETSFAKAAAIDPKNKWYLIDLFEVYYETKDYNQALTIVQKIVPLDKNYKEDQVSLYVYTKQYEKALVLINELDQTVGKTEMRDRYRREIQSFTRKDTSGKNDLEKAIEETPLIEENYLSLISKYSDNNQEEKAKQVAEKLEKNIPTSEWAQVFLFKHYVNDNKGDQAAKSLDIVLRGSKIDKKVKYKMFNEFLIFAMKNPGYETQLNKATQFFENDSEFDVYSEIGKFYYKKKSLTLAITNLEKTRTNDLEANLFLLAAYEETANFSKMQTKASELIDTFPNQPEYYFFAGKASNNLSKFKIAQNFLETGMDYVVENVALQIDFFIALADAYKGQNNAKKADEFLAKANNLKNKRK